jgi:predicted ATP-grasp superfamily ATP-dependent carboligase
MRTLLVSPWAPVALAVARSLKRRGIGVHLLQPTAQRFPRWSFSVIEGATRLPEALVGTDDGIDMIHADAARVGASALVAVRDQDLLWIAAHRDRFEPACRLLAPTPAWLTTLLSKRRQIDVARRAGLTVLPTHEIERTEDADDVPDAAFPLVLRPDLDGAVNPMFKARMATSRGELRDIIQACRRLDAPLLAQPFQRLPNLLVHGARTVAGEIIASRCYLVPRKLDGVTLALEPVPFPDGLEERCRRFAALAGLTGCYHFEFLFSPADAHAFFLEVNVRLGGTTDKVVRTGFDEPALLLQAYGLLPVQPPRVERGRRVVNKRVLIKHIGRALNGTLTELDYPEASRLGHVLASCRDLLVAKDSVFDRHDLSGSLRFHLR